MWITLSEMAARMGVGSRRIRYLVDKGEIKDNGRKGKFRRVFFDNGEDEKQPSNDNDLQQIEARRRLADAISKELKNEDIKRQLIIQSTEIFENSFITEFDEYAKYLYKLEIRKNQRDKLQEIFNRCLKSFSIKLANSLQKLYKPF